MLNDYIRRQQQRAGLTTQELAEKSGVSISTINRIRSGENKNPSWDNMVAIFRAFGGDLNAAAGLDVAEGSAAALLQRVETLEAALADSRAQLDRERSYHDEDRKSERAEIRILRRAFLAMAAGLVVMCYLFVDARNPEWGIFQDATATAVDIPHLLALAAVGAAVILCCALIMRKKER